LKLLEDALTFFKGFFLYPRRMGAILPSSQYLARSMVSCIDQSQSGFVLELGPGTGVITKAILNSGIAADHLISLEITPHFAEQLRQQIPAITVLQGDAMYLSELLKNKNPIRTIISSLPLRSMTQAARDHLFSEIQKTIAPSGQFIQFTYSMRKDTDYYPANFKPMNSFIVWRNIPPARVTVFQIV